MADEPLDAVARRLMRIYDRAAARLERIMQSAAASGFARARARALLEQLKREVDVIRTGQESWSKVRLPSAYRNGANATSRNWGMDPITSMSVLDRRTLAVIAERIAADSADALQSIAPYVSRVWLDARQRLIREEELADLIAAGRIEGLGPAELGRRIMRTLRDAASERLKGFVSDSLRADLERLARGEVISIPCVDGKVRHYDLRYYGKLVAQTATGRAAREGALRRVREFGGDLMQWTVHSGACPMCVPYQGKVFSITGKSEGFPRLTDETAAPIHPRCGHRLVGVSEEMLEMRGLRDTMAEFSTGEQTVDSQAAYQTLVRRRRVAHAAAH